MITFIIVFILVYSVVLSLKKIDNDFKLQATGVITTIVVIVINTGVYVVSYKNLFDVNIYNIEKYDTLRVREYKDKVIKLENNNEFKYKEITKILVNTSDSTDYCVKHFLAADTCLQPKWIFLFPKTLDINLYKKNNGKTCR